MKLTRLPFCAISSCLITEPILIAYGVRTISAPRARSMTSFSRLILAGRVMIQAYPLSAHAMARPIPASTVSFVGHSSRVSRR